MAIGGRVSLRVHLKEGPRVAISNFHVEGLRDLPRGEQDDVAKEAGLEPGHGFDEEEYEKGKPLSDAALEGARLRLRPILMTSFAFILGCVPLWIATGAGSVARQIMGTTVIGGMAAATAIAIFIIPALFVLVERLAKRRGAALSPSIPQPSPSEAD